MNRFLRTCVVGAHLKLLVNPYAYFLPCQIDMSKFVVFFLHTKSIISLT